MKDFISGYADYADVLEAPRAAHEWVAVQLLASVLNRNGVWIEHGSLRVPLDLWVILFSGSGFGRSTLIEMPTPILEQAGLRDIVCNSRWGSPQAMFQEMAQQPHGLYMWGEMSERLKLLKSPPFANYGAMPWLTDRYDSRAIPEAVKYRDTGNPGQDRPAITFSAPPRTNILATSSEEWLFGNLAQDDSAGGFLPRWLLVKLPESNRDVPIPRKVDSGQESYLAFVLEMWDTIIAITSGPADLSNVVTAYEAWYGQEKRRFEAQPNRPLAMAYFNRHRIHVLKLAVICEVSSSSSRRVSQGSWERAVVMAKQLEDTIFALLPTGMSSTGYTQSQMEQKVRDTGPDGLALSEFTRAFQHMHHLERKNQLTTLAHAGRVHPFRRKTSGRTAQYLVHADHVAQYRKDHLEDVAGGAGVIQ